MLSVDAAHRSLSGLILFYWIGSGVYPKTCTLKMDFIVVLRDEDYKQILKN
jgi:hypothetical protein